MITILMTEREIVLARVALFQRLERLSEMVPDQFGNDPARGIETAERYNESRDVLIMLGKAREVKR